jgi:hypothetical protein
VGSAESGGEGLLVGEKEEGEGIADAGPEEMAVGGGQIAEMAAGREERRVVADTAEEGQEIDSEPGLVAPLNKVPPCSCYNLNMLHHARLTPSDDTKLPESYTNSDPN